VEPNPLRVVVVPRDVMVLDVRAAVGTVEVAVRRPKIGVDQCDELERLVDQERWPPLPADDHDRRGGQGSAAGRPGTTAGASVAAGVAACGSQ
jgi:hypothetical protein